MEPKKNCTLSEKCNGHKVECMGTSMRYSNRRFPLFKKGREMFAECWCDNRSVYFILLSLSSRFSIYTQSQELLVARDDVGLYAE